MNLPGEQFRASAGTDLDAFLSATCETCRYLKHCTILAYAAIYGGASEWRIVDGKPVCTRHEDLPVIDHSTTPEEVLNQWQDLSQITASKP